MRRILLIIFCITVTISYGQMIELQGRYSASYLGAESIDFVGKDSFYFGGFYCTYGVYGKGRCEIRDNYLYLFFEKSKKKEVDSLKPAVVTRTKNRDELSVIQLTVVDNKGVPIRYATVDLISINYAKLGAITDTLGKATIKIKKSDFPVVIKTSAIGIQPGKIKLEEALNYNITLFHKNDESVKEVLNNGEIYIYEIDELSEGHILMRPQKSSEPFRDYRKKE